MSIIILPGQKINFIFPLSCKCFTLRNFTLICFVLVWTFSCSVSFMNEILSSYTPNGSCCGSSKSFSMFNSHFISCGAVDSEIYSASVDDRATQVCFLDSHVITLFHNFNRFPVMDFPFILSPAKSALLYSVNIGGFDLSVLNLKCFESWAFQCHPSLLPWVTRSSFPVCLLLMQCLVSLVSLCTESLLCNAALYLVLS